jgi:acyl-coenzyme A thioesterase PaaI-like protein
MSTSVLQPQLRNRARLNPRCFACGSESPHGLRIEFQACNEDVCATWHSTDEWESFQGVIHGGVIATLLDEAMSKAVIARGWEAFTAELFVRFRGVLRPGDSVLVYAHVKSKRRSKISVEAEITSLSGKRIADAWASFIQV